MREAAEKKHDENGHDVKAHALGLLRFQIDGHAMIQGADCQARADAPTKPGVNVGDAIERVHEKNRTRAVSESIEGLGYRDVRVKTLRDGLEKPSPAEKKRDV